MDEESMARHIADTFADVQLQHSFGYTFFFYSSERMLPFATLIGADTEHDRVSQLDRPGVYRLNIGVSRQTFQGLFGAGPVDPASYDYTALDTLMPHPEYAAQSFVCVLSPGEATLARVQGLLAEAYERAVRRFSRRQAR